MKNPKRIAVYPGTFDPITFGHLDVIERACGLFERVVVGVSNHSEKLPLFSLEERKAMIRASTRHLKNLEVECFQGLLVDFAKRKKSSVIIRGLRELSDFQTEFQRAIINRKLAPNIETVFVMTNAKFFYVSSSIVKEVCFLGGKIDCLVPKPVEKALKQKFAK